MKITAVGDILIQQRLNDDNPGIGELARFIAKGDVRFFNLETTLNKLGECYASQFSGGTYLRANPEVLDDLKIFDFNIGSFNNNHTMDFSYKGLLDTLEKFEKSGISHTGVGRNLEEASKPAYIKTNGGTASLISLNTDFDPSAIAGNGTDKIPGRPGVNGIRIEKQLILDEEDFAAVKRIAEKTAINSYAEISRREGYTLDLQGDEAELDMLKIKKGSVSKCVNVANEKDMVRAENAIGEAKKNSDYVMVSIHTHIIDGDEKESVTQVIKEISHRLIDSGANAVICHGPHLLRPVEIYNDSPIFYSLGDFVLQLYSVEAAPAEFYEKYGLTSQHTIDELLKKRSNNYTRGLMEDKRMLQTVIPYWETDGNKLSKLILMPVELQRSKDKKLDGLPSRATDLSFIEKLAEISAPFGTKITVKEGLAYCEW